MEPKSGLRATEECLVVINSVSLEKMEFDAKTISYAMASLQRSIARKITCSFYGSEVAIALPPPCPGLAVFIIAEFRRRSAAQGTP
jgi:hypothetical protein